MPLATPEDLLLHPPPPLPDWVVKRNLLPCPEYQVQFRRPESKGKPGDPYFFSNVGSQTHALVSPFDETVIGGERGGAKTMTLIAWCAMGDQSLAPDDPARYSFLLEPTYRALLLRKEYQAMADFVDEAAAIYKPLGGEPKDDPVIFRFKSGARIYTNHLGDKNAFEKYRGWGITRIGIEELTQIEEQRWYLKLLGSMRTKEREHNGKIFPPLRTQIMATTNPDGPGRLWVARRFVKVLDSKGNRITPNTPVRDPYSKLTRIFIPMKRSENPYLRDNKAYEARLLSQDEVTQRQWMHGDWDAQTGLFFTTYRPNGPVGDQEAMEFPWARHIPVGEVKLRPWWFRWGSLDVGYDHPASSHKFCRNAEDKRIHVYDELSVRHMDSYELGVLLAKWWIPELEALPDHQIVLYVSPDAFSKQSFEKTRAEQLEMGVKEVLGPYGAIMLRFNEHERDAMLRDPARASAMFAQRRAEFGGKMGIAIKAANNNRAFGCDYINQLLRFRPTLRETVEELGERLTATYGRSGLEAYEDARAKARLAGVEILPRVQIWAICRELDRCLKQAIRADPPNEDEYLKFDAVDGQDGDDALEDFRYGCMGFKEVETAIPKEYFIGERIAAMQAQQVATSGEELTDMTRLIMIQNRQRAIFDAKNPMAGRSFTPPRASSARHRRPN